MVHKLIDARSSRCGVPFSPRTKSELNAHQMAPAGVVAHPSSWTPAAYEPEERNLSVGNCNFGTFSSSLFGKRQTSLL